MRDPQGNHYIIEGILGKGDFGAVYLVRERGETHNVFALKEVIHPNKDDRVRIAFEGEVLTRLRHKALPRVHRVFEHEKLKRVYLLMDYIKGQNLEVLREEQPGKRFSLPLVLTLLAPIAEALTYLHTQDPPIVHRDIQPANIILPVGGGEAVLADFGSAKEYVQGTATIMIGRTSPGYASLEQYRSGTNPSTDIYGLGATVYALLTGSAPVDAPSRAVRSLIAGVDPLQPANLLNPAVPQAVAEALQRAMSIKIADRFETVEEFWQVLLAHGHDTRHLPHAPSIDPSHPSPAEQGSEDGAPDSLQGEHRDLPAHKRRALRILLGFLVILAIGTAFFSYARGLTVLLLCCLGVLLLSLGALLYDVSSRAGTSQKNRF